MWNEEDGLFTRADLLHLLDVKFEDASGAEGFGNSMLSSTKEDILRMTPLHDHFCDLEKKLNSRHAQEQCSSIQMWTVEREKVKEQMLGATPSTTTERFMDKLCDSKVETLVGLKKCMEMHGAPTRNQSIVELPDARNHAICRC